MSSSDDYCNFEEMDEYFSKKVLLIKECTELKSINPKEATFFHDLETSMVELRSIFLQIRGELKEGNNQFTELKDFLQTMESLNGKLDHMQQNFPAVLKRQSQVPPKREKVEVPVTPVVSKKTKIPDKINCLTLAEFESVPQYMKGRLQYTQVNSFINSFNATITSKYKLLSAPRKTLKPQEFKLCNLMKCQENDQTKGKYFCTGEDLKEYGNVTMDKTGDKISTILRHCKRMKEVRGPGAFKRYVVIA